MCLPFLAYSPFSTQERENPSPEEYAKTYDRAHWINKKVNHILAKTVGLSNPKSKKETQYDDELMGRYAAISQRTYEVIERISESAEKWRKRWDIQTNKLAARLKAQSERKNWWKYRDFGSLEFEK